MSEAILDAWAVADVAAIHTRLTPLLGVEMVAHSTARTLGLAFVEETVDTIIWANGADYRFCLAIVDQGVTYWAREQLTQNRGED